MILENPKPDFQYFEAVIRGQTRPERVHLAEVVIDPEVLQFVAEKYLHETWPCPGQFISDPPDPEYIRLLLQVYRHLGYDYAPVWPLWVNLPKLRRLKTEDTALISRGEREWVDEKQGLITSWDDLEKFPWDEIHVHPEIYQMAAQHLPPGMKIVLPGNLFEFIYESLLGYEGLFYLLADDPSLVAEAFNRWGQVMYRYYSSHIGLDCVGAIFHCDDMGFKTSTLISPQAIRSLLLPWLKKFAMLAHDHGKTFWLHSCGNIFRSGLMEDLIEDVQIDAFHSFQDLILPVGDFVRQYGNRVATLGGIDMDVLTCYQGDDLRRYIQDILQDCMPYGRFALGAGNTITNFIPLENYQILLEESRMWSGN